MEIDALEKAVWTATAERIARYTVGIAIDNNQLVGTGTLVRVDKAIFVLTALHVVGEYGPDKMKFWCRPDSPMIVKAAKDTTNAEIGRFTDGESFPVISIIANERYDIAYIQLDPFFVPPRAAEIYDVANSSGFLDWSSEDIDGKSLFIFGFPVDNSRVIASDGRRQVNFIGCANLVSEYDPKLNGSAWPAVSSKFSMSKDFVFKYYQPDEQIDPNGFSGSGVCDLCRSKQPSVGIRPAPCRCCSYLLSRIRTAGGDQVSTHIRTDTVSRVPHISILRCGHSRKARTALSSQETH